MKAYAVVSFFRQTRSASQGKKILIVGTKKLPERAADSVALAAIRARCLYFNKKGVS